MARKDVDPEYVRRLHGARQAFLKWRAEFPERVKELRAQQREVHVRFMEDAALDMLEAGASVAFVMDTYGTSDRRVVNRMLENAQNRRIAEQELEDSEDA